MPTTSKLFPNPSQWLPADFELPPAFKAICEYSKRLGKDFDYLRCDFFCTESDIYGCEFTVYSLGGYEMWPTPHVPEAMGSYWDLRKSWFLSSDQRGWKADYASALRACAGPALPGPVRYDPMVAVNLNSTYFASGADSPTPARAGLPW
jgi:hypothetical protein